MKSLKSFESGLRREHRAVTSAAIEAGLVVPSKKSRPPGIPYDRRAPLVPTSNDDGEPGLEVTLNVRIGSKALPVDLYEQFVAKAKAAGLDPEVILSELVREWIAKPAPVSLLERPPGVGWWFWRQCEGDAWQPLKVGTDKGALFVWTDNPDLYQCDAGEPEQSWHGEWHPVAVALPTEGGVR